MKSLTNSCIHELGEKYFPSFLSVDFLNMKNVDLYFSNNIYGFYDLLGSSSLLACDILRNKSFNDMQGFFSYDEKKILNFDNGIDLIKGINDCDTNVLIISFTSDCWLEVCDSTGKKLYIGTQHFGNILTLKGKIPYRLVIGAPQSTKIRYQGNIINLDKFIRPYRVARLIIPDQ